MAWGRKKQGSEGERPRVPQSGRPSASVFSYYSGDRQTSGLKATGLETAQKERQDRGALARLAAALPFLRPRYLPTLIAVVVIVISFAYLFFLNTDPRVIIQPDNAATYHTQSDYEAAARTLLAASPLSRSKLTINTTRFRRQFMEEFPEASVVNIALPVMGRRPVVTMQVMPPAAVLSNATTSFVIDSNGRAVLPLNQAPSSLVEGLPSILDESNLPLTGGKIVLNKEAVAFVAEIVHQFQAKKAPIQSIVLSALPNEIHVRPDGAAYYVKFDDSGNPRSQAGAYFATRDYLAAKQITPAEYIDVRVPEKAFYK